MYEIYTTKRIVKWEFCRYLNRRNIFPLLLFLNAKYLGRSMMRHIANIMPSNKIDASSDNSRMSKYAHTYRDPSKFEC